MKRNARFGTLLMAGTSLAVGIGACDSGPNAPEPGTFLVEVTSNTGPPGGAIVTLEGAIVELIPESGRAFHRATPGGMRAAIVGTEGEALRFRVRVPDASHPPTATVEDVVSFGNERISTSPYRATVTSAP